MIAELEDLEKEIDFDEFLDAITNKLGKFNYNIFLTIEFYIYYLIQGIRKLKKESIKFLNYLMMICHKALISIT
jgi:uncharacterized protein (DUF2164 family)